MTLEEAMHEPFFTKSKIPKFLPTSLATTAPKSDFLEIHEPQGKEE
jgi:hypothetical protein